MKKISTILLTLFITLTFSNSAIAKHSEESGGWWDWKDLWTDASMYRCRVIYIQSDAPNEFTKDKTITTQHRVRGDYCDWGARHLSKKIKKWLKKDTNNIFVNFRENLVCKKRTDFKWSKYDKCDKKESDTEYRTQMFEILIKKYPNQVY
jgi:hypothetical protein